jgi:protein TonB
LNELALFQGRVRQAVQRAVVYPMATREMRELGRAEVSFTLRDGQREEVGLAQSSGSPLLDRAAIAAVRGASYPAAPPSAQGQAMRFLVWVAFRPAEE